MLVHEMAGSARSKPKDPTPVAGRYVFPQRLRELRKHRNWSQAEVARRIHVERSLIGNYELGINQPTIGTALRLADLFEITLDSLVLDVREAGDRIHDRQLLDFFVKADSLPWETKAMIKSLIEGLLAKVELEKIRLSQESRAES